MVSAPGSAMHICLDVCHEQHQYQHSEEVKAKALPYDCPYSSIINISTV